MQDAEENVRVEGSSEGDIVGPETGAAPQRLSLQVLVECERMQLPNGLRQNDYQRYTRYCSRRLRRIRKSLKFMQGRNRYVGKPLPETIDNVRYLLLVLVQTERCWSYGMCLKAENAAASTLSQRVRLHSIRRFGKAVRFATKLEEICAQWADRKTQLEAQAYRQGLSSVWLAEKGQWSNALEQATASYQAYSQLKQVSAGGLAHKENELIYKTKLSELQPTMRLCQYNLQKRGIECKLPLEQEAEEPRHAKHTHTGETVVTWRGRGVSTSSTKVEEALRSCTDALADRQPNKEMLRQSNENMLPTLNQTTVVEQYGEISGVFLTALELIHQEMINPATGSSDFTDVEGYTLEMSVCLAVERTLILQLMLFWNIHTAKFDGFGRIRLDEGVRYAELLVQGVDQLVEGRQVTPAMIKLLAVFKSIVTNSRALSLAFYFYSVGRCKEAHVLVDVVMSRDSGQMQSVSNEDDEFQRLANLFDRLRSLVQITAARLLCLTSAEVVLAELPKGPEVLFSPDDTDPVESSQLISKSEEAFPPKLQAIPCKPMLFDLAMSNFEADDSSDSLTNKQSGGGLMGRLSSWWGKGAKGDVDKQGQSSAGAAVTADGVKAKVVSLIQRNRLHAALQAIDAAVQACDPSRSKPILLSFYEHQVKMKTLQAPSTKLGKASVGQSHKTGGAVGSKGTASAKSNSLHLSGD
eukprot:GHVS01068095.1.p1 GENE.GHVS01068095.1~~GHVS01068095.1.p1  ORF type:complete len:695 (-),score=79.91 GHVS01068095.1:2003-4087(-)